MLAMNGRRRVGVVYNPLLPGAQELVAQVVNRLGLGKGALVGSVEDLEKRQEEPLGIDLMVTVGGDGTILRAAKVAVLHDVPILGINMGRVGFMTEINAHDAVERLPHYLENNLYMEERTMLQIRVVPSQKKAQRGSRRPKTAPMVSHALNEAVVGTGAVARMATVRVAIDGSLLTIYRADAVIVATATGSTGYALSAGGPILYPQSKDFLLKAVAVHQGLGNALVIPSTSHIQLTISSNGPATLTVDGFTDVSLREDDQVEAEASKYVARFLRARPPSHYYSTLAQRLGLEQGGALRPRA